MAVLHQAETYKHISVMVNVMLLCWPKMWFCDKTVKITVKSSSFSYIWSTSQACTKKNQLDFERAFESTYKISQFFWVWDCDVDQNLWWTCQNASFFVKIGYGYLMFCLNSLIICIYLGFRYHLWKAGG